MDQHRQYMQQALDEARKAFAEKEVPIGAVVVWDGEIAGRGRNRKSLQIPTAHAEMFAIEEAARKLGRWRLAEASLYVTLEPCTMCAGAMVLAKIKTLCFALKDPKSGACGSVFNAIDEPRLNHRVEVIDGVLGEESLKLLQMFFGQKRRGHKYRPKRS